MTRPPPRSTRTETHFPDTTLFRSDELYVEDDGLVRADRRLRGVAVGLLGRQHDLPARAGRHLRQRFAQAHQRDLAELHAHRAGLLAFGRAEGIDRSEEHTSELQSLMRISYAVFCLKKKNKKT